MSKYVTINKSDNRDDDPDGDDDSENKLNHPLSSPIAEDAKYTNGQNGSIKSPKCGGLSKLAEAEHVTDPNRSARNKLLMASVFCLIFMVGEVVGGYLAHSLAIMTDAAHLLSDLAGFLISIFALWVAAKEPTSRLSFGFHRAEILGALMSVLLVWVLTGVLVYEAIDRIQHPTDVDGKLMFIVAACGLGVNVVMGFILFQADVAHSHGGLGGHGHSHGGDDGHGHSHGGGGGGGHANHDQDHDHDQEEDLHEDTLLSNKSRKKMDQRNVNVRAAFVHVLGDGIQSIGVMIAAGLIWHNPEWRICDPICTFLFSILVLFTTVRLVKQSAMVLMEGSPDGIDPDEVQKSLQGIKGVTEVHDLHIWSLSVGKPSLSVHMLCTNDSHAVLQMANEMLVEQYNIHHTTIQVEKEHDQIHCNPKEQERRQTSPDRTSSPLSPVSDAHDAHRTVSDSEVSRVSGRSSKVKKERAPHAHVHTPASTIEAAPITEESDLEAGAASAAAAAGLANPAAAASSSSSTDANTNSTSEAPKKSDKPKKKKGGHGHSHGPGGGHGHSHGSAGGGHGHAH